MPFAPRHAALISGALIFAGTGYSIFYSTWLDTSDPLLTGQPHPLNATHYFASKQNPLNIVFLKRLWFWTTAAFGAMFFTSPPDAQTYERIYKYTAETALWWIFTSWFFGPAILERVISITGGECSVTLPSGYLVSLPAEYCYPGGPKHISPATHPTLFAASLLVPETEKWKARPRLRKGHDISGHIFLLTMSCLFLVDQLLETRRARGTRDPLNKYAMYASSLIIAVEFFSMYVTSVYFHSPSEKFTGLLLGFAGYAVTKLPLFFGQTPLEPVPVTKEEVVDAAALLKETVKAKTR